MLDRKPGNRIVIGITSATLCTVAAQPIITEIVGDLFPDKLRGTATGMMHGLISLIGAFAIPLFGLLANIPHGSLGASISAER
jgi:MFS family permease